jgi:hypothetical protein
LKVFEEMMGRSLGEGKNPYTVNVISFSGHGITVEGDAIAVIPEINGGQAEAHFINMSGIARKFASKKYTLNIFLCSMCRLELSKNDKIRIFSDL